MYILHIGILYIIILYYVSMYACTYGWMCTCIQECQGNQVCARTCDSCTRRTCACSHAGGALQVHKVAVTVGQGLLGRVLFISRNGAHALLPSLPLSLSHTTKHVWVGISSYSQITLTLPNTDTAQLQLSMHCACMQGCWQGHLMCVHASCCIDIV